MNKVMTMPEFFEQCEKLLEAGWRTEILSSGLVVLRQPQPVDPHRPNHWDVVSAVWHQNTGKPREALESGFDTDPEKRFAWTVAADELGLSRENLARINAVTTALHTFRDDSDPVAVCLAEAFQL